MGKRKAVRRRVVRKPARRPKKVQCGECPVIQGGSDAVTLDEAFEAVVAERERRARERAVAVHGHTVFDHLRAHVAHHHHVYKASGDITIGIIAAWAADGIPHFVHIVVRVIFG